MIVITAPTGNIGSQVVEDLLDADQQLRLIVRDAAKIPTNVLERVEVVEGSHGDAAVIERACEGAKAVFWLTPNIADAPTLDASFADFARPACRAFAASSVERVVGISALGRGTPQADHAGYVTASLAMDDLIASSGVAYRAVVNPSFMDNLLQQLGPIKEQGKFFLPVDADLEAPSVATRDIAAVSARLLVDDSWTEAGEVACLGPKDLSFNQMAAIMSEVLGTEVSYQQIPGEAFKERMTGFGMSEAMAGGLVDMFEAKNKGLDNAVERTPESSTPTTFEAWCEEVLKPALGE